MSTRALSEAEYLETFGQPMRQAGKDEEPPFDFWGYFENIPPEHFASHDCSKGNVDTVYREPSGRFAQ